MNGKMTTGERDRLKTLEIEMENIKKDNESMRKEFEKELLNLENRVTKEEKELKEELENTRKIVTTLDNQAKSAKIIFVFMAIVGGFITWIFDIGTKISTFIKQ